MPNLTRTHRWEPFAPNLGNNLELPPEEQFELEVAAGLTKVEVDDFERRVNSPQADVEAVGSPLRAEKDRIEALIAVAGPTDETNAAKAAYLVKLDEALRGELVNHFEKVLTPVMRLGTRPLTVNGTPIATLRGYLELVVQAAEAIYHLREAAQAVRWVNTMEGSKALFSERLSGGGFSTRGPKTAAGNQRAGR